MKKSILKGIFFGIVLFAALIIFEVIMNQGNTDMTADMPSASYPLAYMEIAGEQVNSLHPYAEAMDVAYMRDTLTPVDSDRKLGILLEKYGRAVEKITFEVRNADGSRLIENTEITDYNETKDQIKASFTIKDLLETGVEYNLVLLVQLDNGEVVRYYTRILYAEDYHVTEKLSFVKSFHEATFDKARAEEELVSYLESNSSGDNSTFHHVDIHSSLEQITWGDLKLQQETDSVIDIKEMMNQTASMQVKYVLSMNSGKEKNYYRVTEFYRIRYSSDRVYLLDFSRDMEQLFQEDNDIYASNKISLGIQNPDNITLLESDGGEIFGFTAGGRLLSYNVADNEMAILFSFYDSNNFDARTLYNNFGLKILNVDETGNVQFMVYGYMNRGLHEGRCGVQVNYFNNSQNTIEEQAFIPSDKSPDILMKEIQNLSYVSTSNCYYFMIDNSVYELNLDTKACRNAVSGLKENSFNVARDGNMLVWIVGEDEYSGTQLVFKNLKTGKQSSIDAGTDEYIRPLGFIGDDLIYGIAKKADIITETSGRVQFPIYEVLIVDSTGNVLKQYQQPGIYVTDCTVSDNQIVLSRVVKDEVSGNYVETEDDQIMNSQPEQVGKNTVETIVVDTLETITQISVKTDIKAASLKVLTPKEVLFEGGNEVLVKTGDLQDRYYVYTLHGLSGIYTDPASAVNEAENNAGVVTDDTGNYVWYRGNRLVKNQIMKIQGTQASAEKSTLAVCLDTVLGFEGVSRSTQYMLDNGKSVVEILQENVKGIQVLDLSGCSLDAMLYYVNQDIPVLAMLQDQSAVLVIGFNEYNVVFMNPELGTVYKVGMNDATTLFEENGNAFITYVRTEE